MSRSGSNPTGKGDGRGAACGEEAWKNSTIFLERESAAILEMPAIWLALSDMSKWASTKKEGPEQAHQQVVLH